MLRQIVCSLIFVGLAAPALAQSQGPDGGPPASFSLGDYGAPRARHKPETAPTGDDPSLIHRRPDRWPWLEPGTMVCSTQDDLQRYRQVIAARLSGAPGPDEVPDCHRLRQRTPVDIAARQGPATTEIHLNNDAKQTAWTDVWLPAQRPN